MVSWARLQATSGVLANPRWGHVDQLAAVISAIRTNPDSVAIWSAPGTWPTWPTWRCPPCHTMFQFYVADGKLSCQLYQRSPTSSGRAFNIASYALLTCLVAQVCEREPGAFVHTSR